MANALLDVDEDGWAPAQGACRKCHATDWATAGDCELCENPCCDKCGHILGDGRSLICASCREALRLANEEAE